MLIPDGILLYRGYMTEDSLEVDWVLVGIETYSLYLRTTKVDEAKQRASEYLINRLNASSVDWLLVGPSIFRPVIEISQDTKE